MAIKVLEHCACVHLRVHLCVHRRVHLRGHLEFVILDPPLHLLVILFIEIVVRIIVQSEVSLFLDARLRLKQFLHLNTHSFPRLRQNDLHATIQDGLFVLVICSSFTDLGESRSST